MDILKKIIRISLPIFLYNTLRKKINNYLMRIKILKVNRVHQKLIENKKNKKKLKVVFFVIHRSVWKVDNVFQSMLQDSRFEPIILICPYSIASEKQMFEELNACESLFRGKGYPVLSSYDKATKRWLNLATLEPDIIFFTNPHKLTFPEYYEIAYHRYLCVYLTYHYEVGQYDENQSQYNQEFHNLMWMIFAPHEVSLNTFKKASIARGKNVTVTGFPPSEQLVGSSGANGKQIWKNQSCLKKKIIWAPHHTISDPNLPYSTFLRYADYFRKLALDTAKHIQWAFKPHPVLFGKLCQHPLWGEEKTKDYYQFWELQENTQLEEGDYVDLFLQSDALIHDSGSFLAEYLLVKKPVLFLKNGEGYRDFYNEFGNVALDAHIIADGKPDIEQFIFETVNNAALDTSKGDDFIAKYVTPYFERAAPSERVLEKLREPFVSLKP